MAKSCEEIYIQRIESGFRKLKNNNPSFNKTEVKEDTVKYILKLSKLNHEMAHDFQMKFDKEHNKVLTFI